MANIELISCANPKYAFQDKTMIQADIEWSVVGKVLTIWLDRNDSEPHIQDAITRIEAGEFGAVGDFVAPPNIEGEDAINNLRRLRNEKLTEEVDPIVSNPLRWASMTEAKQQEWADYRQALLDLPACGAIMVWSNDVNDWQWSGLTMPTKPE